MENTQTAPIIADPKAAARPPSFLRDENGTILFFTVIVMIMMFILGGMGLDIMKYEVTRTELQQTSDRATLAATSLTQGLDSTDVVHDYFDKAGLGDKLTSVTVTSGLNFRTVRTEARANTNPIFLRLYERSILSQMEANALSIAEQRISNVEIILVLDVSGSMGGRKLNSLKDSAKEFVDTVMRSDEEQKISISIVPYNAQVNIPQVLKNQFNFTNDNGVDYATCVELPREAFDTGPISRTIPYAMSAYSDLVNGAASSNTSYDSNYDDMVPSSSYCLNQAQNLVMLPTRNVSLIKAKIDALTAGGNTSVTLGMKWGLTLIDPSMKSAYTAFVAANAIPPHLAGRPYEYEEDDSVKVIVLMTDGEHVQHTYVPDAYKTGPSPIWRAADGYYSIEHTSGRPYAAGNNTFWVPHRGTWQSGPWGAGATRQNWQDIWSTRRMAWVARQLYGRALGNNNTQRNNSYSAWVNNFRDSWLNAPTMDTTLQQTCSFARESGVIVYGIAFEAPDNASDQIRDCASTPGHYFNATGLEIQSAFRAIASNISQLRLTE